MSDKPWTIYSTGLPPWVTSTADDLSSSLPTTAQTTHTPSTFPSTLIGLTESVVDPQSGGARDVPTTTTSSSTAATSTAPSAPKADSTTKTALSISIPIGIMVVIGLLLSGIMIGRRMARRDASGWTAPSAGRRWMFWRRRDRHVRLDDGDQEDFEVSQERCELSGEDMVRELPTAVNIQEMEERREPVELPVPSLGSLRSLTRDEGRSM